MTLEDIIKNLNLTVLAGNKEFSEIQVYGGYASDLLSCVLAGERRQGVWITLQAHMNVVAVASMVDLSAVIITEGAQPDDLTINRANEQDITLLSTPLTTYEVVGRLWQMGLRGL